MLESYIALTLLCLTIAGSKSVPVLSSLTPGLTMSEKGTVKSLIYGAYLLMLERGLKKLIEKSRARVELVGALRP